MGRIKDEGSGKFKYYVEIWSLEDQDWVAEVRSYNVEQDVNDYPDNNKRRNFKALRNED